MILCVCEITQDMHKNDIHQTHDIHCIWEKSEGQNMREE